MPGPKMGPRPPDFDEDVIRQSPTFIRWLALEEGGRLRYACREFVKGFGDDEERLMRRIMIARRNNIRDHETLKKARKQSQSQSKSAIAQHQRDQQQQQQQQDRAQAAAAAAVMHAQQLLDQQQQQQQHTANKKSRTSDDGSATPFSRMDQIVEQEMDCPAVERTRSYRTWKELPDGSEFVYNQKYIKGQNGHDWLLRKNIWRRMRYRRENKKLVERMVKGSEASSSGVGADGTNVSVLMSSHDTGRMNVDPGDASSAAAASGLSIKAALLMDQHHGGGGVAGGNRNGRPSSPNTATHEAAAAAAAATTDPHTLADQAAVEAAVAAAETFGKTAGLDTTGTISNGIDVDIGITRRSNIKMEEGVAAGSGAEAGACDDETTTMNAAGSNTTTSTTGSTAVVHNPLEDVGVQAALDAAAKLAAEGVLNDNATTTTAFV